MENLQFLMILLRLNLQGFYGFHVSERVVQGISSIFPKRKILQESRQTGLLGTLAPWEFSIEQNTLDGMT